LTNHPNKKADQDNPTGLFDLAAWKKKVLDDPESRAVIEDFLKHRHREGEYLGEDAKLKEGRGHRSDLGRNSTTSDEYFLVQLDPHRILGGRIFFSGSGGERYRRPNVFSLRTRKIRPNFLYAVSAS